MYESILWVYISPTKGDLQKSHFYEINELAYQGDHHDDIQIFYTHEDITNTQFKLITIIRNGKEYI